jgi:hypothetical protein
VLATRDACIHNIFDLAQRRGASRCKEFSARACRTATARRERNRASPRVIKTFFDLMKSAVDRLRIVTYSPAHNERTNDREQTH